MALTKESLLEMYWRMLLSRRLDERVWELHKDREIQFHHSGIGHEAAQVGTAFAVDRQRDWVVPYYRDLALVLTLGLSPREYLLSLMGKAEDPASGGRQMPTLWSLRRLNIISTSPVAAAQISHAVGVAMAIKNQKQERVVVAACGEGATSAGEWYESVSWAAVHKLPIVFLIENNRYALSTSQEDQMAVPSTADKARGLGLPGVSVDGTEIQSVYRTLREAVDRARAGSGPAVVEACVHRITPHSSDDDDRQYRRREDVELARRRDPLLLVRQALEGTDSLSSHTQTHMENRAREIIADALAYARQASAPDSESGAGPVYAEDIGDA